MLHASCSKKQHALGSEEYRSPAAKFLPKKKAYDTSAIVHRHEGTICLPGPCAYPAEAQARIVLYPLPLSMSLESLEVCDSSSLPDTQHTIWQVMLLPSLFPTTDLGWELLACGTRTDKLCVWGLTPVARSGLTRKYFAHPHPL